jgi:hypothetical protein
MGQGENAQCLSLALSLSRHVRAREVLSVLTRCLSEAMQHIRKNKVSGLGEIEADVNP